MKTTRSDNRGRGFTLVELLCVMAIIAILAAMFLPAVNKGRERARQIQCVNHLHETGVAFHSFAHEHNSQFPMAVAMADGGALEFARNAYRVNGDFYFLFRQFQVLSNELVVPKLLVCPADTRLPAPNFGVLSNANLSYFVGLSAQYNLPNSILAGDRNLVDERGSAATLLHLDPDHPLRWTQELHRGAGNLLFADGHVEERHSGSGLVAAPALARTDLVLPTMQGPQTGAGTASAGAASSLTPGAPRSTNVPLAEPSGESLSNSGVGTGTGAGRLSFTPDQWRHARIRSHAEPPPTVPAVSKASKPRVPLEPSEGSALATNSARVATLRAPASQPPPPAPVPRAQWLATGAEQMGQPGRWWLYLLLLLLAALLAGYFWRQRKKRRLRAASQHPQAHSNQSD